MYRHIPRTLPGANGRATSQRPRPQSRFSAAPTHPRNKKDFHQYWIIWTLALVQDAAATLSAAIQMSSWPPPSSAPRSMVLTTLHAHVFKDAPCSLLITVLGH
ncbi:hypothetical protein KIN20_002093 [Parelaphostrongylus tenuis]|uniref:Uncharacterized protein n=1 Tax=Parelaphostrongylus tenuis TaxID=148309 RepID=A0AAD5QHJ0_PARTN|nr:hypothetical protein KIN20_002093 [Parelaphostrongylus tenuis]